MRIAFLFSLGGYKALTQSQEIKKTKPKLQLISKLFLAVVDRPYN